MIPISLSANIYIHVDYPLSIVLTGCYAFKEGSCLLKDSTSAEDCRSSGDECGVGIVHLNIFRVISSAVSYYFFQAKRSHVRGQLREIRALIIEREATMLAELKDTKARLKDKEARLKDTKARLKDTKALLKRMKKYYEEANYAYKFLNSVLLSQVRQSQIELLREKGLFSARGVFEHVLMFIHHESRLKGRFNATDVCTKLGTTDVKGAIVFAHCK